jgi:hypothetical protein
MRRKKSVLALLASALLLTGSGYAASGGVGGDRSNDRASNPGNGHCGHTGNTPPCGKAGGYWSNGAGSK